MISQTPPKTGLFVYLLMLTGIFALLEMSFFLQGSGLYLGDFKSIADRIAIPRSIFPGILFYLSVQLSLHLAFTASVWAVTRLLGMLFHLRWATTQTLGFYLWGLALFAVLLANQQYFPLSKYADLMASLFGLRLLPLLFLFISVICCSVLLLAMLASLLVIRKKSGLLVLTVGIALSLTMGVISLNHKQTPAIVQDAATVARPNIIVIGIDSLRPDYIGYFGAALATPHLNQFLTSAVVFGEAITPIARTYPAWMSVLTGEYPKINGARFDLMDQRFLNLTHTLPAILQQHGYKTIFAMDETRFSNIDTQAGFDTVVTPPVGLNDFLLGTFNDFPLSNLVVNTRVGKWLFPYSYGNRPAFITYEPKSFQRLLQPVLQQSRSQPVFLAVHFCLPHFPYLWRGYPKPLTADGIERYRGSIERVDRQLNAFMTMLEQDGLLQHSIVILLSDHGEAFELSGDRITAAASYMPTATHRQPPRFYPPSLEQEAVDQSTGHGTDVLSMSQYHTVFAVRLYGLQQYQPRLVSGVVTLLDIKPTVLAYLGIHDAHMSGQSLLPTLFGQTVTTRPQHLFLESDFSPEAVHTVHPETRKIVFEGIDFFEIDPVTTRLTIKPAMGKLILSSKQFADVFDHWILALYPQPSGVMMPVLVDLNDGHWTTDLRSAFAVASPAASMLRALRVFYGDEIRVVV